MWRCRALTCAHMHEMYGGHNICCHLKFKIWERSVQWLRRNRHFVEIEIDTYCLISLSHYSNLLLLFSCRTLKPPIHWIMTQPTHIWACTYAHIEMLMCTAHSSALNERILLKFQILANKCLTFPKNEDDLIPKIKTTTPKKIKTTLPNKCWNNLTPKRKEA